MKNKILIISLILSLIISPIIRADLNIQNLAGSTIASAGALTVVMAVTAGTLGLPISAGLAVGALGVAILFDNKNKPIPSTTNAPIQIRLNPKVPLITPTGWTPASGSNIQPTPPNTSAATGSFNITGVSGQFTNPLAACTAFNQAFAPGTTSTVNAVQPFTCQRNGVNQQSINGTYACPTGYSLNPANSSSCNLQAPTLVIKPIQGQMVVTRNGDNFVIDPQINPADRLPSTVVNVTSKVATITDQDGNTTKTTINTDSSSTVVNTSTNTTNNTTNIKTINYSAPDPSTGDVTVLGTNDAAGTGTGNAVTATPTQAAPLDISSLNKESTQQNIKSELVKLNDYMKCDNCVLPENLSVQNKQKLNDEIKKSVDELDKATDDYNNFKNFGWTTWVPTFPTGSCSPMVGSIRSQNVSWNFCPYVAQINQLLGWLLNLFGAWTITGMFFRRE